MYKLKIQEHEKDLQCSLKHQSPILMVNLNPNLQPNQRLLCENCLYYFESDTKIIGLKKIIQMIEEEKKKSINNLESLIRININNVQSVQNHIQKLKSSLVKQLDILLEETKEWVLNLQSISQKSSEFSFFKELDYIINNQQSYIEDQVNLTNKIKTLNDHWNNKVNSKLEIFKQFNEYQMCKEALNNLSQEQTIQQNHNQNVQSISNFIDWKCLFNVKQLQEYAQPQPQQQQRPWNIEHQVEKKSLFGFMKK
ncbi:unnamed protein product [Paramecium octaurelia]|uniref:Uncharacterized protein n=1 Tax=Paramecium octaurelia TaxID=43137 RepID=A0A8S1YND7_PAROT|nr:unnamed protein product [Paramecium octaurelia]